MKDLYTLLFAGLCQMLIAQNTVGLLSYEPENSYQGYTVIYPHNQPTVYLLDNCGEIVHSWTDSTDFRPGNTAYILPNGDLMKCKRRSSVAGDPIWAGGGGAFVELRSWDNDLLWQFELNDSTGRLHHDIAVMPNGNVLLLAWEYKTFDEAVAAGRNPATMTQDALWPDYVMEMEPFTGNVVWEWHVWDHLIQDFDSTKANYGVVADHPELVDINWDTNDGRADWMHTNSIDYNPELDQIMISVPQFHEIWVIDHSTTTEQAASHFGGNSNHGGDLLYRVGNPAAYQRADAGEQISFYQHDAHWADDFLPDAHPFKGNIVLFNNRINPEYSTIEIFESSWNMYLTDYERFGGAFPPFEYINTITPPDGISFVSSGLSSAQILPNGNILGCSGRQGYVVELTPGNEVVWEYKTPIRGGMPVEQGTVLTINNNLTFRAYRYPPEYSAFDGRDLTSQGWIELNPDTTACDQFTSVVDLNTYGLTMYPNPAENYVHLTWETGTIIDIQVIDMLGRVRLRDKGNGGMHYLDLGQLEPQMYVVLIDNAAADKLMVR